ncbi:hypothetical protein WAI453_004588 [Rhynchosporium graminicola]
MVGINSMLRTGGSALLMLLRLGSTSLSKNKSLRNCAIAVVLPTLKLEFPCSMFRGRAVFSAKSSLNDSPPLGKTSAASRNFFKLVNTRKADMSTLFCSILLLGRTKGSPVTELPQPIQDTIQAARKLDQRYLCIDSTCINQDNHEDWNTGYKKMEAVFQDAYYTIAATSAEESTKGFPNRPLLAEDSNYVT